MKGGTVRCWEEFHHDSPSDGLAKVTARHGLMMSTHAGRIFCKVSDFIKLIQFLMYEDFLFFKTQGKTPTTPPAL